MKKNLFLLVLLTSMSAMTFADDIITVSNDVTYTVTNEGAYAWTDSIPGQMTSTNHAAGTSGSYIVEFESEYPIVFSIDYSIDAYNNSSYGQLRIYYDNEYSSYYGTRSGSYTYYFPSGSHSVELRFFKDYYTSTTTMDRATFSNLKLISTESQMMTIPNLTPGTLGVEVLGMVNSLPDMKFFRIESGTLNSADWTQLGLMTGLQHLDISGITNTEIPAQQFKGKNIKFIDFPTGLKTIGNEAFYNAYLRGELRLPAGLESIGSYAFYNYDTYNTITKVKLPSTITSLGAYAFRYNRYLEEFDFNGISIDIPSYFLQDCDKLITVKGCENITTVGNNAFRSCEYLETIEGLKPVTVEDAAFSYCYRLKSIDLSNTTSIGSSGFNYCDSLKTIDLSSLTSISSYAFQDCDGLTSVIIPDKIISIPNECFIYCRNLQEVVLGASITSIGNYAFYSCPITRLYVNAPAPPTVVSGTYNSFSTNVPTSAILYVPDYAMVSYKLDSYWSKFTKVEVNPNPVTDLRLSTSLELTSGVRIQGSPNLTMTQGSKFTINGDYSQALGNVILYSGVTEVNSSDKPSSLISRCANMTADSVTYYEYVRSGYWYFMSLPYHVAFNDITCDCAFVIRRYDGEARANNGTGYAWKNVVAGDTLWAGTGYAFRVQTNAWIGLPGTEETENMMFRSDAATTPLAENASAQDADAGWNLVGNPYPAYYDIWYMNYTAPITVWNEKNSNYTAYSIADDDFALRPCQAFFVQRPEGVDSITFGTLGRQHTTIIEHGAPAPARHSEGCSRRLVDLVLSNGIINDRTRIVRNALATDGFEATCDATKMMSMEAVPQFYSHRDDMLYAINEGPQDGDLVWLGLLLPEGGSFTIEATRCEMDVELYDLLVGQKVTLDTPYTFTSEAGEWNNRFVVRLGGTTVIDDMPFDSDATEDVLYDLMGRRTDIPTGGIYIRNGKKVIVR